MATFGKCVWDGCTRHAEKEATSACRAHHLMLRDARCQKCQARLTNRNECAARLCRRCTAIRAA
jgi:hypothetical protein